MELALDFAVRGRLVPQVGSEGTAEDLLANITNHRPKLRQSRKPRRRPHRHRQLTHFRLLFEALGAGHPLVASAEWLPVQHLIQRIQVSSLRTESPG
jgi:hypothetical protein